MTEDKTPISTTGLSKPYTVTLRPRSEIVRHLRAMGAYFDIDEKRIEFYIAQLILSKKI